MKIRHALALAAVTLALTSACQQGKTKSQSTTGTTQTDTAQRAANNEQELRISFTMPDINGNDVSVTDEFAKHKITVVDFWASWCGPCRQEMPNLVKTYNDYKDKGLGIIGVSLDEHKEQWADAVSTMNMTWTQLSDLQGWNNSAAKMYGIQAIPFTIIVDNTGKVIAAGLRGDDLTTFIASRLGHSGTADTQR